MGFENIHYVELILQDAGIHGEGVTPYITLVTGENTLLASQTKASSLHDPTVCRQL